MAPKAEGAVERAREAYEAAYKRMQDASEAYEKAAEAAEGRAADSEENELAGELYAAFEAAQRDVETAKEEFDRREALIAARERFSPILNEPKREERRQSLVKVDEPDLYRATDNNGRGSFLSDLFRAQCKNDLSAAQRIARHHEYMVEQRAVSTGTLGGVIPPAYLIDLYAKASRNGRVFADQANHQTLPDVGMSVVVPRFTAGLAAGVQTAESTAVTTQDPTEADLSIPVRTLAGYSPVSRQTLERAAYSDQILFEDLIARYFAALDTQCLNGSGASGQILGAIQTAGISTSTVATTTVAAVWPKIADLIQQIETAVGGLGYNADKIIMHPRRYGFFSAALDSQNRPLMVPSITIPSTGEGVNVMAAGGDVAAYGFTGTLIQGLPVYTDANIPTNFGAGTNEDRILVEASRVVHLWERPNDPVTLSFEQQAGTSLQVQLICYGYAAFTAGRYPAAFGMVQGAGLVPPTF